MPVGNFFKKHKSKIRKGTILTLWSFLLTGLFMTLGFVGKEEFEVVCSGVVTKILPLEEPGFVNREMILKTIRPDGDELKLKGTLLAQLNTPLLERRLQQNEFVRNAEVFTDMNGLLHIHIHQREPILRVSNSAGEQFYIDRDGLKMPVSTLFTAHVPIATGNIFEPWDGRDSLRSFVAEELFKIATYVDKDAFWKAQIEQIFVNNESELVLVPKVGDHTILFGNSGDMQKKFDKLLLFYREALSRMGWDQYSCIDLRFEDQVVCKKKKL